MRQRHHVSLRLGVVFICLWSLLPVYWALNTSLTTEIGAQSVPAHFLPNPLDFGNYQRIFGSGKSSFFSGFRQSMVNTVIESGLSTIVTVVLAALAAYAFARMRFFAKRTMFYVVLATMALPAYATLIPLYRILSNWGLVNTYTGVILVYVSGFLPLAMWILYNYFLTIPRELEEAAFIDGCSEVGTLVRVVLPLAVPGVAAVAIITFLSAWSQFLFPLVLTSDISTQPTTVFMTSLQSGHLVPFTLLNAVGVVGIAVPALLVFSLNRYIINGILAGSLK
jgi:multiple sugar transport system permease protein